MPHRHNGRNEKRFVAQFRNQNNGQRGKKTMNETEVHGGRHYWNCITDGRSAARTRWMVRWNSVSRCDGGLNDDVVVDIVQPIRFDLDGRRFRLFLNI